MMRPSMSSTSPRTRTFASATAAALSHDGDHHFARVLLAGRGDLRPVGEGVEHGPGLVVAEVAGGSGQVAADDVLGDGAGLVLLGVLEAEHGGQHRPEGGELAALAAGAGAVLVRVERRLRFGLLFTRERWQPGV